MEVHTIPVMPEPMILEEITAPDIRIPPVQVETLGQARFYLEACDAFESVGDEDAYNLEEVRALYPGIDLQSACYWAVYGWNTQNFITVEDILIDMTGYANRLRSRIEMYKQQLMSRYEATQRLTNLQVSPIILEPEIIN